MGLFDDVSLSARVRDMVREQYCGDKEISFDGWQTKSISCEMGKVLLADDHVETYGERRSNFTGEIVFYHGAGEARTPTWEWLEFIAIYVDGKLVAVRHLRYGGASPRCGRSPCDD